MPDIYCDTCNADLCLSCTMCEMREREKLEARIIELEADKRRLDWIETHGADVVCLFWREGISIEDPAARYDPPHWMVCPGGDLIEGADDLPTVRDAIDAAITAEKSGSRE